MTDNDMLVEVKGRLAHLSRAEAVARIAEEKQLTRSGVSGMVTRAEHTPGGHLALLTYHAQQTATKRSAALMQELVDTARLTLSRYQASLKPDRAYYAVYLPDMHVPKQHGPALELTYNLIAGLPNVAYVSALNDGLDFARLSKWSDRRDGDNEHDLRNNLEAYAHHLCALRLVAPDALFPAIIGNHDARMFNDGGNGTGDYIAYSIAKKLASNGALFLDVPDRENVFCVNGGLVWAHGYRAMADRRNSARKNYQDILRQVPSSMRHVIYDLVIGHTHAALETTTLHGAKIVNAGCLCNLQPGYMRKRPDWQLGMVISKFYPFGREHDTRLITINERAGRLEALNPFNGRTYSVKGTAYD
jgi:hypothetical protein